MAAGKMVRFPRRKRRVKSKSIAARVRNQVYKMSETKRKIAFGTETVETDTDAMNLITNIAAIAEGSGPTERIGNTIKPIGLRLKVLMQPGSALDVAFLRVMLLSTSELELTSVTDDFFLDSNAAGTNPTAADTTDIIAPVNKYLCNVHFDRVYSLSTSTGDRPFLIDKYFKLSKQGRRKFDAATTGEANKHNFRLCFVGRQAGNASDVGEDIPVEWSVEYFYKDM